MQSVASLPAASPSTVLAVFLQIFSADPQATFKRKDLQQQGIAQCRQAVTLLRFLRLVTEAGRLEDDVRRAREKPAELRAMLQERFKTACTEAGFWTKELVALGAEDLTPKRLTELLYALEPIERQKSRAAKTNMVGCLRTLHHVLLHCDDPGWLESEYQARRAEGGSRPAGPRPNDRASPPAEAAFPRFARFPGMTAVASPARDDPSPAARLKSVGLVEAERFHVDFTDEGDKVFVEAWFDPPLGTLTRRQLLSLAKQIQERAGALPVAAAR